MYHNKNSLELFTIHHYNKNPIQITGGNIVTDSKCNQSESVNESKKKGKFLLLLFFSMIAGGIFGSYVGKEIVIVKLIGELFIKALKMIIIPLVFSSMIVGITGIGDVRKLGKLGGTTFLYYMITTFIAVLIGILLVTTIQPGKGIHFKSDYVSTVKDYSFLDVIRGIIPANPIMAAANGEVLPLIFFSLFFGIILSTMGREGNVIREFVYGTYLIFLKMTDYIIALAPLGIFSLVATRLGQAGGFTQFAAELKSIWWYCVTVLSGLFIHGFIILPLILIILGKRNPITYFKQVGEAIMMAFSTSSSSATLPVSLECTIDKAKVDQKISSFVLPLGATVNMDGTALYEAVAAIFIAQAYGKDLTMANKIVVALTATLAAIGAAGIPQAGLVTMVMILNILKLPVEGIGLILSVDWFLDRCRTTVNVWGDIVGAAVVEKTLGDDFNNPPPEK